MKAGLFTLILICGLFAGCLHRKADAGDPADPGTFIPPPAKVAKLDEEIDNKKREVEMLKKQPKPKPGDRTDEELEKEIEERKARIKFLNDEIAALLNQRKAAEIYYRQKELGQ